jgi:hypothetical protein
MPNGDHDKLIEPALAWATEQLRTGGHIPFMVFTIDKHGREGAFAADPACFAGGDSGREDLAQRMRKQFRKADIVRYAIAAECWVTHGWRRRPGLCASRKSGGTAGARKWSSSMCATAGARPCTSRP